MAVTRRLLAVLALAFAVFAVYGSLIPLEFQPMSMSDAIARFRAIPYLALGVESRADFVANILLFVPLGLLAMGACRLDRSGASATAATAMVLLAAAAVLAVSIEFAQVFHTRRTVSLNDIFADCSGAAIGIILWIAVGSPVVAFVRLMARPSAPTSAATKLLIIYAAGFVIFQVLPLDVTIQLSELSEKYREGRLRIVPFTFAYSSGLVMAWDYFTDALLTAPIGALFAMAWGRRPLAAWALATLAVAGLELAQVFVFTRYADSTDVITGSLGAAAGVAVGSRWSTQSVDAGPAARPLAGFDWRWLVAAGAWTAILLAYSWYPFDFHLSRDYLRERTGVVSLAPFRNYYFGSEYHAVTELARKSALAAPWGALLALTYHSTPRTRARTLHVAVIVFAGSLMLGAIEAGQVLLPERYPDVTDVLTGVASMWVGARLTWWAADSRA